MNRIRRLTCILAALAAGALALGSTPAFAERVPPGGLGDPPFVPHSAASAHLAASGGMAGWQITLIAAGAAVLAATVAVLLDRARTARRHASPRAA
ncbi:MAG TPA: hypothetical protein VE864_13195 [Streptosporangiaceae bacterium]|nr:hypothetical protein [Streptosporangiaceae bacterium]